MKKKKVQKFPSESELAEMRALLSEGPAARPLPKNADPVQRIKHSLCEKFVIYKNKQGITQKELAQQIGIDEALMSKILNYAFEEFTVDRLVRYLSILFPNADIRLLVA